MDGYVQVSTTAGSREAALELAGRAVELRLAGSAQVFGPVESVFWHKGEFGTAQEWQVWLKTTAARYPELEAHLIARHPWDNPEVTATQIAAGAAPYLAWLDQATTSAAA